MAQTAYPATSAHNILFLHLKLKEKHLLFVPDNLVVKLWLCEVSFLSDNGHIYQLFLFRYTILQNFTFLSPFHFSVDCYRLPVFSSFTCFDR